MGKFEIIRTRRIKHALFNVNEEISSANVIASFQTLKELNQHKSITVCELGPIYVIVDGNRHFKELEEKGIKKVLCYNLGSLSTDEYIIKRLLLNLHQSRLSYIEIAEQVKKLTELQVKETTISNLTGLTLQTVERYGRLLDFNWDEFLKSKENLQINPFEDER